MFLEYRCYICEMNEAFYTRNVNTLIHPVQNWICILKHFQEIFWNCNYIHHEKYSWNSFIWEYSHFCYWVCHFCSKSSLLSTVWKWLPAWSNFKSVFCIICTYRKWHFKPKKSSILYFQVAKDVWLSHTRYVNLIYYGPYDGLY